MAETDQISDPFAVVIYHHKKCKTTNHGNLTKQNAGQPAASEGDQSPLSQSSHLNQAVANSFLNTPKQSTTIGLAGVQTDIFDSEPTTASDSFQMPTRMNPHKMLSVFPRVFLNNRIWKNQRSARTMLPLVLRTLLN